MVISEKNLQRLSGRLSRIASVSRKRSNQIWRDETEWLKASISLSLVREVRKVGPTRPGGRIVVSGSSLLDRAADRWRGRVLFDLGRVVEDFRVDTYEAARRAYGLPITKGGKSRARNELVGGSQPRRTQEWMRSFGLRYGNSIEDIVVSASADGDDLDSAVLLAEARVEQTIPAIGMSFNAVLLSPGGSSLRVAASE